LVFLQLKRGITGFCPGRKSSSPDKTAALHWKAAPLAREAA
jgi:hypothetical protein